MSGTALAAGIFAGEFDLEVTGGSRHSTQEIWNLSREWIDDVEIARGTDATQHAGDGGIGWRFTRDLPAVSANAWR